MSTEEQSGFRYEQSAKEQTDKDVGLLLTYAVFCVKTKRCRFQRACVCKQKQGTYDENHHVVEHGKSPLLPVPELAGLGFKIVIFPGSIMLSVCILTQRLLREIRQHGTTARLLEDMLSVQDFFGMMGL